MAEQTVVVGLPGGGRIYMSLESLIQSLQGRSLFLENPKPLLTEWARILRVDARRQFSEGGDPAWKQLAASTIAQKIVAGYPRRNKNGNVTPRLRQNGVLSPGSILIASGGLRDSWGLKNDPNHIEIIDIPHMIVKVGSKSPLAIFHQYGTQPYTINPKQGGHLAFIASGGKLVVTDKPINHPGLVARPVRITDRAFQEILEATDRSLKGEADNGQDSV